MSLPRPNSVHLPCSFGPLGRTGLPVIRTSRAKVLFTLEAQEKSVADLALSQTVLTTAQCPFSTKATTLHGADSASSFRGMHPMMQRLLSTFAISPPTFST